jgi:hypothetical protein
MLKLLTLLLTILFTLVLAGGYLVINEKIHAGERSIAEGQNVIAFESPSLEEGKIDLASGRHQLSEGKKEYQHAHDNPFMVFADKWFNSGKGFADGRKKIAEGEEKVAKGEDKINAGEIRLDKGNLALEQGMDKLQQGKKVRDLCAIGAIIFTLLSVVLGYFWRRSLLQFIQHIKLK